MCVREGAFVNYISGCLELIHFGQKTAAPSFFTELNITQTCISSCSRDDTGAEETMLKRLQFFILKYSKNSNIVKYYYNFK